MKNSYKIHNRLAEGSAGLKRLNRKETAFKKGARKAQNREFDWKPRSGESGDDIVGRTTVARKEGEALHKKRLANASRLGRKKAEGEGRASAREFGVGKHAPTEETPRQAEIQRRVAANKEKKVT